MNTFAERFGVAPVVIPTQGRDTDLLRALQFEALAGWTERAIEAVSVAELAIDDFNPILSATADELVDTTAPDYDAMTRAEAIKRAEAVGMPVSAKTTKAEAVDYLQAAAGMSEDEQQALDAAGDGRAEG